jgi:hypothetical protein
MPGPGIELYFEDGAAQPHWKLHRWATRDELVHVYFSSEGRVTGTHHGFALRDERVLWERMRDYARRYL